jgi:arylsulfatase A-like enzyme
LKDKEIFNDTLFVITSDHGEVLGEYKFMGKEYRGHAPLAYNVTLRVPLIFSGKGIPKDKIVSQTFRHIDILPTFLSLLGIPFNSYSFEGIDLSSYILSNPEEKELEIYAETLHPTVRNLPEWRVLIKGKWKYIFMSQTKEEFLYNLEEDPKEEDNLVEKYPKIREEMKAKLLKMIEKDKPDKKRNYDQEVKESLKALGYL